MGFVVRDVFVVSVCASFVGFRWVVVGDYWVILFLFHPKGEGGWDEVIVLFRSVLSSYPPSLGRDRAELGGGWGEGGREVSTYHVDVFI